MRFFRARFQVTLLHMGYFGSLLRCDTKVTVLRIPTKKSEKFGLKSRDHFLTRALNHLNFFEVPMPEPPLTWCFPAEFSGFSGDLAKKKHLTPSKLLCLTFQSIRCVRIFVLFCSPCWYYPRAGFFAPRSVVFALAADKYHANCLLNVELQEGYKFPRL